MKKAIKDLYSDPNFWWKLCFVVGISFLIVFPRILSLESAWAPDETTWLLNSRQFIQSLQNGNLGGTIIFAHPGVTTMWLGGISLWIRYKGGLAVAENLRTKPLISPETLAVTRMGVALTTSVAILVAWYFLIRLFGWWKAGLAIIFISVDYFYLSLSRMLHTDALESSFILLSVLSFFAYLELSQRSPYIIFSGVCFGLACLSKSTALILALYPPLVTGFYRIFNGRSEENKLNFSIVPLYFTWLSAAFLTFIGLWPGLWQMFGGKFLLPFFGYFLLLFGITCWNHRHIKNSGGQPTSQPKHLIPGLLTIIILGIGALKVAKPFVSGIQWGITTPHDVPFLFFGKIVQDAGILFYPFVLSFRSSLFTLPLFILGFTWFVFHYKSPEHFKVGRIFLALSILIPLFIVPLSLSSKKLSRYILPVLLFIDILAAIGLSTLLKEVTNLRIYRSIKETGLDIKKRPLPYLTGLLLFIPVMFFQIVPVLAIHPYYVAYYNPLWKITDVAKQFSVGGGVGLDLAGRYLSQKPGAEQLIVRASPVAAEFVKYYFPGKVIHHDDNERRYPDYEVVHLYDIQVKWANPDVNRQLEYVVRINGIDFVWIYGSSSAR